MATGTRMQQSQRALEEQLGTIQETLKQQDAGAIQRHEQLRTKIATQANNLQEQSYKLEAQKVCYEELRQQKHGLTVTQSEQQQSMDLWFDGVQQQVKSLGDAHALDMKHAGRSWRPLMLLLELWGLMYRSWQMLMSRIAVIWRRSCRN